MEDTDDDMEEIVTQIVERCKGTVSRALVTFVTRVVIENDPIRYPPESELDPEAVEALIATTVDRISEKDSPAMETIKMQVAFDSLFVEYVGKLEAQRKERDSERRELIRGILATRPKNANDFDTLNVLYKRIFQYLLKVSKNGTSVVVRSNEEEPQKSLGAEREVAAALESVFPRIGLKSFVHLSTEEKKAQLDELAKVVTGIRLFNKATGKGGAGLDDVQDIVLAKVKRMRDTLDAETTEQHKLTTRYQETLVYCHLRQPEGADKATVQRWGKELTNRRQYGAYLTSLAEDAAASKRRASERREVFYGEIDELKTLVGERASVPKDQVYPKFETVATAWFDLDEELRLVETRAGALENLVENFKDSYDATLPATHPVYRAAKLEKEPAAKSNVDEEADLAAAVADLDDTAGSNNNNKEAVEGGQNDDLDDDSDRNPVRLSVESTPEFMQLPLEYQGFCGWTVANRHGLLLPGKPALGVVKYRGAYYVFAHAVAMTAFMQRPDLVKNQVLETAAMAPELVHLLRLQDQYPGTSVAHVIAHTARMPDGLSPEPSSRGGLPPYAVAAAASAAATGFLAKPVMRDAATETPTHFREKYIDYNYEWNEWALRRRALRMTQLKHCATTSQQTDASAFRRENSSQVYLPRINSSQTRRDNSCNPPIRIQYLSGARGLPSKFSKQKATAGIVDLTFELS